MQREKLTRSGIMTVASELFLNCGYNNTSMNDIAAACGIKKPSLYHHFTNREALLLAVIAEESQRFNQEVLAGLSPHDTAVKEAYIDNLKSYYSKRNYNCLMSRLYNEISSQEVKAKQAIQSHFFHWNTVHEKLKAVLPLSLATVMGTVSLINLLNMPGLLDAL